jgi:hypothetical protein
MHLLLTSILFEGQSGMADGPHSASGPSDPNLPQREVGEAQVMGDKGISLGLSFPILKMDMIPKSQKPSYSY